MKCILFCDEYKLDFIIRQVFEGDYDDRIYFSEQCFVKYSNLVSLSYCIPYKYLTNYEKQIKLFRIWYDHCFIMNYKIWQFFFLFSLSQETFIFGGWLIESSFHFSCSNPCCWNRNEILIFGKIMKSLTVSIV